MEATPQFGATEPGRTYGDRAAAFGIAEREGAIALVRIEKPGLKPWFDLPGGAIDAGEDEAAAVRREFAEETGLKVRPIACFVRADQFFINVGGVAYNNRGGFWTLEVEGEAPELKVEDDHALVWIAPDEAVRILRHDAHAWAVAAWLRRVKS